MNTAAIATLAVTLIVAVAGYFAKYLNDSAVAATEARLERTNAQLRDLYGPLFSLARINGSTWGAFVKAQQGHGHFTTLRGGGVLPQTPTEVAIWRHWMTNVFQPLNAAMIQCVLEHADLLDETEMPEVLLRLGAHARGYEGVIASWDQDPAGESSNMSLIPFPGEALHRYTETKYIELKSRQQRLLEARRHRFRLKRPRG